MLYVYLSFLLFLKDEQFTEFIQFWSTRPTSVSVISPSSTLIVLIVEQTDITGSGTVQTIFQRDVVNEGFGIIRRIFARRYLTADYNLEAVIEEALCE